MSAHWNGPLWTLSSPGLCLLQAYGTWGGRSREKLFPEVEKVLCDLRQPPSLSEPPLPGLLYEHLDLGETPPQPLVVPALSVIPPLAGPATWPVCLSHRSVRCIVSAQLDFVEGAGECIIE